eukprot:2748047-Rhodomonas_salina.2
MAAARVYNGSGGAYIGGLVPAEPHRGPQQRGPLGGAAPRRRAPRGIGFVSGQRETRVWGGEGGHMLERGTAVAYGARAHVVPRVVLRY